VRSLARTSAGVRFEDQGEQVLKGVGELVRVGGGPAPARNEKLGKRLQAGAKRGRSNASVEGVA